MFLLRSRRFLPLFVVQLVGAFSDNVFKNALVMLTTFGLARARGWDPETTVQLIGGVFIAPFVLASGWAGMAADRCDRARFVRAVKLGEVLVMALAAYGLVSQSLELMLVALAGTGLLSALFGPLKYALLPEYLKPDELMSGNAWFEGATFLAILAGTIVGGSYAVSGDGRLLLAGLLVGVALIGWVASWLLPPTAPASAPIEFGPKAWVRGVTETLGVVRPHRVLFRTILGISWFWALGFVLLSAIPPYVVSVLNAGEEVATRILALFSIGVAAGSYLGHRLNHGRITATYVPLAGFGLSFFLGLWLLWSACLAPALPELLWCVVALLGICGGIYAVPLYTLMQHRSPAEARSRTIAANNIWNALFMLVAAGIAAGFFALGGTVTGLLALIAALNFAVAVYMVWLVPESVLHTVARWTTRWLFKVRVLGLEQFPQSGPRLVIANHTSWIDAALLTMFLPERPIFAVNTLVARYKWVQPFIKWIEAYPLDPTNPLSLKTLVGRLEAGRVVVIFPEGRLSTTGGLMKVYDGPGLLAAKSGAQIIPVHIDGAYISVWTRLRRKYQTRLFPRITLTIHAPASLPPKCGRDERSRRVYHLLSDAAYASGPQDRPLYETLIRVRRTFGGKLPAVEDPIRGELDYDTLLRRAAILGERLARDTRPSEAVGVLLPTGVAAVLTFWALQYGHRLPCWLNFTMGPAAFASTVRTAGIRRVITARAFIEAGKLEPLVQSLAAAGVAVDYLEDLRPTGLGAKLAAYWTGLRHEAGHHRHQAAWRAAGADPRATVLFTSGSSGLPKAVVLSHANLRANVQQLRARIDFTASDKVFNCLPLFHAFGLTGGLLMPLLSGVPSFHYPTPLHYGLVPEFIYNTNSTIFFATNSFLQGYARKAHPYDFYSLRYVFAGAEKLQPTTRQTWAERFGVRIFEGYGTTEAAPVVSMNTPLYNRVGTVGLLLPGLEYRLEPMAGVDGGRLWIKGPNVMLGYYLPEQPGVLVPVPEGWYDTGDIARVDAEGFLTLLGRAKRFAKVAGEMVSLAAVETWVQESDPAHQHAVAARPHPSKGEELVLVTTHAGLDTATVRAWASARGIVELAVPRQILHRAALPLLGTGKPDLVALQQLVTAAPAPNEGSEETEG